MMKSSRRVERTRVALQQSLIRLMLEKPYERVTVQDIIEHAGIGRATFYSHYSSKEQLLLGAIESLENHLKRAWHERLQETGADYGGMEFALDFFRHVGESRNVYYVTLAREADGIVERRFRKIFAEMIRTDLAQSPSSRLRGDDLEAAVQFILGALMSTLRWWIESGSSLTADEINARFVSLSLGGVNRFRE